MAVNEGRWTSHVDGDFVLLLVGASPRHLWHARQVGPLVARLVRTLDQLERDPRQGLLGHQQHGGRGGVVVQYWRSLEALDRVAKDPSGPYADAFRPWFGPDADRGPSGFWHETYVVRAGEYEASYRDVPAIGLLRAGVPAPSGDRSPVARDRLRAADGLPPEGDAPLG